MRERISISGVSEWCELHEEWELEHGRWTEGKRDTTQKQQPHTEMWGKRVFYSLPWHMHFTELFHEKARQS